MPPRPPGPVPSPVRIRPYRPADAAAVDDICIRTGAHGEDATGTQDDPTLYPEIWARPYVALEPDLAFVAVLPDDGDRVVGYVLGTADTATFQRRREAEWSPGARARHPLDAVPPGHRDRWLLEILHDPSTEADGPVTGHPAHLHIDLLPEAQGLGAGRRLIDTFCAALVARGVPGVHLGASDRNTRAIAFYRHVGFTDLGTGPGVVYLGRRLTP